MKTLEKMPAGTYYVGDPCYVFDKEWDDVLASTGCLGLELENERHFEYKGRPIGACSTAHGDGTYNDQKMRSYPVDAGIIGAVSIDLIKEEKMLDAKRLGHIVEFKEPFEILYNQEDEGTISIGDIDIVTDPSPCCENCGREVGFFDRLCWECHEEEYEEEYEEA